jgi:hypothetical protein
MSEALPLAWEDDELAVLSQLPTIVRDYFQTYRREPVWPVMRAAGVRLDRVVRGGENGRCRWTYRGQLVQPVVSIRSAYLLDEHGERLRGVEFETTNPRYS